MSLVSQTITIEACGGPRSRTKRKGEKGVNDGVHRVTSALPNDVTDKIPHACSRSRPVNRLDYERRWAVETWFSILDLVWQSLHGSTKRTSLRIPKYVGTSVPADQVTRVEFLPEHQTDCKGADPATHTRNLMRPVGKRAVSQASQHHQAATAVTFLVTFTTPELKHCPS